MNSIFFKGTPNQFGGGLTNETEIVKQTPQEFFDHYNKWAESSRDVFFKGADLSTWKFISKNKEEISKQITYWHALLSGWSLKHEQKEAAAAWMLSEMLTEPPPPRPPKN